MKRTASGRATRRGSGGSSGAPSDARLDVEEYAYDPFGNMTRRTILSPAGRGTTEAQAFAFEPGAAPGTTPTGDGSPNRNRIAARALYDGSGNAIMDNGAPRAAQDVEYDLDGNAVRLPGKLRQTVGASWDALGRMTTFVEGDPKTELGAPAETYRYAADGFRWLRAGTDGRATLTLRDAQGRPLAEYVVARGASGPTLSREYVHALGQVVAERTWTGGTQTTTYHHRDHLGSLRVATDGAGALADAHDYYPFGGEMGPVASSSRKKFTGHERDEETGLDYMLARYHSPGLGRFLSVDPGRDVHPENPQSWNLYAYVRNNPVNATDPTGKWEWLKAACEWLARKIWRRDETKPENPAAEEAKALEAGGAGDVADARDKEATHAGANLNKKLVEVTAGTTEMLAEQGIIYVAGSGAGRLLGAAGRAIRLGAFKSGAKWASQMAKRGWTEKQIAETIEGGEQFAEKNFANGNPETRFVHPTTGRSVIVDDVTNEVIHVGGDGFDY